MAKGLVNIYAGDGKGKSPAALGRALQAAMEGKSVVVLQFLKGNGMKSQDFLRRMEPEIKLFCFEKADESYENLSEEEKQEILTALQGIRTMQNIVGSRTLEKLSGMFQLSSENWFEVDFSRWGNEAPDNGKFERLRAAIVHCRKVRIRYAGSNGSMSVRNVEPHKLAYKASAWYLKAFCCVKQDWRVFKLNRILDLEMLDEDFEYRDIPEPAGGLRGEYPEITLRFSREAAYRVYDEFDAAQIKRQENGDLIVSERMPDDAWLIGFLLSLGTQVEVLSPGYLREILAGQAKEIYEMNRSRM